MREAKGHVTQKGYIRHTGGELDHRRVWRKHYGPVPVGFFIHHKDMNKKNNNIENLELIDALTHKRIHGGCELRDGSWWKPCTRCGVMKPVETDYYAVKGRGIMSMCKTCCIGEAVSNKRKRKLKAKGGTS